MSGQKRLRKNVKMLRVVATPSKTIEGADGSKTQLYTIRPMS